MHGFLVFSNLSLDYVRRDACMPWFSLQKELFSPIKSLRNSIQVINMQFINGKRARSRPLPHPLPIPDKVLILKLCRNDYGKHCNALYTKHNTYSDDNNTDGGSSRNSRLFFDVNLSKFV